MEILNARHRDDLVRALGLMLVGATFSACGAPLSEVKTTRTVSAAPKPSVELLKRLLEMRESVRQRYEVGRTLDEQLAEAIRAENYELAATIRDKMLHEKIRSPTE
jgi:hypothetical protein